MPIGRVARTASVLGTMLLAAGSDLRETLETFHFAESEPAS